jgi:ureidoacrylate peracid hydrolase
MAACSWPAQSIVALGSLLRNLGVTTLLLVGVNVVDQCVLGTLQDARCFGDDCVLLKDCSGTTSPEFCVAATLYTMRQCFGFVARSEGFLAGVGRADERRPTTTPCAKSY